MTNKNPESLMKMLNVTFILIITILFSACASHRSYETGQFRDREIEYSQIALDKDGLSQKQIEAITSTKPPESFPVDVAIIILKNGYIDPQIEDTFTYNVIRQLNKSEKIKRITLIPEFLVPTPINFNAIQELGVRSLSEYMIVFNVDSSELFKWTTIVKDKYEISSSVNFILVDSFTSAMLASDKLFSTQEYFENLFELDEKRKAQKVLFSEQSKLLADEIDILFTKK